MDGPNVLLVVLDSVRAKNLSLYGHARQTTPFLDAFSEEATVYHQARAPGIHSVASHASIFTGYHVEQHRVTDHAASVRPETTVWHELSERHGYATGIFSPNFIVTVTSNLAEPFETFVGPKRDDRDRFFRDALAPTDIEGRLENSEYLLESVRSGKPLRAIVNGLFFLYHDRGDYDPAVEGADAYVDDFLEWSADRDGPWAACLNLMDAHYPYVPQSEYDHWGSDELHRIHENLSAPPSRDIATSEDWWKLKAVEDLYDSCIRQADAGMERLVTRLRERGDLDDTLLVITSDHGEGFGEWSRLNRNVRMADHSWGIHETLTHVPLIVSEPDSTTGADVHRPASLTEFPAVVDDLLDGDEPSFVPDDGPVLASTFRLEDPESVLPDACEQRHEYAGPWRAVYETGDDGVIKHAENGETAMSRLVPNAQDSCPTDAGNPDLLEAAFAEQSPVDIKPGSGESGPLEAEVEDQLEQLGYLR